MEMSWTTLSVDGSFRNPIVVAAFVLWCLLVALVAAAAGAAMARLSSHRTTRIVLLLILTVASPFAVRLLAWWMYILPRQKLVGVHFWDPPRAIVAILPALLAVTITAGSYLSNRSLARASK